MEETPDEKKEVWISCRATEGCPGRKAIILFVTDSLNRCLMGIPLADAGGKSIRYRCTTCNKDFHICQ